MPHLMIRISALLIALMAAPSAAQAQASGPALLPSGQGVTRALVVGIDRYPNLPKQYQLSGAAADARDIASALGQSGVHDLQLLLDLQATRAAFTSAMEALIAAANAGDLIIITFAGHGSQDKEHFAGNEPDQMDETFLLSPIGEKGDSTLERIVEDEILDWSKRLASKGAEVVFLADSCHGGGMTKAPEHTSTGTRSIDRVYDKRQSGPGRLYIAAEEDRLALASTIAASDNATLEIPSLTFLAGADAESSIKEITISGQKDRRGALSYAFARALEQADGEVTRGKLFRSVRQTVQALSEHQQNPVIEPSMSGADRVLFRKTGKDQSGPPRMQTPVASREARIVTLDDAPTAAVPYGPHAYWEKATGNVVSETGTILAYSLQESALGPVAQRLQATTTLAAMSANAPLPVELSPGQTEFVSNQKFTLRVGGVQGRYIVIANIAGNGETQYLFPPGNADPLIMDSKLEIPMLAGPPFGTDTLVVLASTARRKALELDLQLINTRSKPEDLLRAFQDRWTAGDLLGVITYRTKP